MKDSPRKWPKRALRAVQLFLKRCFFEEILVLGDSHASVFRHKYLRAPFGRYFFNVFNTTSANASGLDNPNS